MTRKGAAFLLGLVVFGAVLSLLFHQGIIKGSDTDLAFLTSQAKANPDPAPVPEETEEPEPETTDTAAPPDLEPRNPTLEDYLAAAVLSSDQEAFGETLSDRVDRAYEIAAAMIAASTRPQTAPDEE